MNGLSNSFAVIVDDNLQGAYINNDETASSLCDDNEWDTAVAQIGTKDPQILA